MVIKVIDDILDDQACVEEHGYFWTYERREEYKDLRGEEPHC